MWNDFVAACNQNVPARYRLEAAIACTKNKLETVTHPRPPVQPSRHGECDDASRTTRCASLVHNSTAGLPLASLMTCNIASTSTGTEQLYSVSLMRFTARESTATSLREDVSDTKPDTNFTCSDVRGEKKLKLTV